MWKSELRLLSMKQDRVFVMESASEDLIAEFLTLFADSVDRENMVIRMEEVQQNSVQLRNRIDSYVSKYESLVPQVNQLRQIVSEMKDGESFFLLANESLECEQLMELHARLMLINENRDFKQLQQEYKDLFGCIWQNYNTSVFTNGHRVRIGEPNRERRRCRFCGRRHPDAKFGQKAHAISEALGNKNIYLYEECDQCNEHFGHGIERDLITLLNFYRSFYGIPGKKGKPKIKGANFTLQQGEKGFEIISANIANDPNGNWVSTDLEFQEKITLQNVYRAFCKYALSVIDDKHLQYFENTIKWIRGEKVQTRLPRVATAVTTRFFESAPSIAIHLRKVSDTDLPHLVSEFHFTRSGCKTVI